ncbi:hypothetical protein RFZ01_06310, partial [Acinetobacter pittii]|uniref:hypothetical protein n=1 Tax=Acinetobacter pittii TaxID=48296 RepID=UPI002813AED5
LAAALEGDESFLRSAVGVAVFSERGLLDMDRGEELLHLQSRQGRRADLEESAYILRLRRILSNDEKGGR